MCDGRLGAALAQIPHPIRANPWYSIDIRLGRKVILGYALGVLVRFETILRLCAGIVCVKGMRCEPHSWPATPGAARTGGAFATRLSQDSTVVSKEETRWEP